MQCVVSKSAEVSPHGDKSIVTSAGRCVGHQGKQHGSACCGAFPISETNTDIPYSKACEVEIDRCTMVAQGGQSPLTR